MTPAARAAAAIEVLTDIDSRRRPAADVCLQDADRIIARANNNARSSCKPQRGFKWKVHLEVHAAATRHCRHVFIFLRGFRDHRFCRQHQR